MVLGLRVRYPLLRRNALVRFLGRVRMPPVNKRTPSAVKAAMVKAKFMQNVMIYPHPKLREENKIVRSFDDDLRATIAKMINVMYDHAGVGLSAPQFGVSKRFFVMNIAGDLRPHGERVVINPTIISSSQTTYRDIETCLSFPDVQMVIPRSRSIIVEYQDERGTRKIARFIGHAARIVQHECDHLDNKLFIDVAPPPELQQNRKRIDTFKEMYGEGAAP